MATEPPFTSRCLDFGCDTNGCPFERAEDAPADCSRTVEHRDAVRAFGIEPPFILCERHPDCLFQGGCECKRQQIRQRAAHPDQPDTQEGGSDEPRLVQ